ncbi:MAG: hypothetical protein NZ772_01870 [Cyanobacteria bacterium]|nr:hypothetical protein [Cyanobacteriota bacterium]MDW8200219.1 hypothetical protein [Cyanobacteriota bacterium SKYGB_h_bin112]
MNSVASQSSSKDFSPLNLFPFPYLYLLAQTKVGDRLTNQGL